MKKWVKPELNELKASWTKDYLAREGGDSYGEANAAGIPLGSCKGNDIE